MQIGRTIVELDGARLPWAELLVSVNIGKEPTKDLNIS